MMIGKDEEKIYKSEKIRLFAADHGDPSGALSDEHKIYE